MKKAYKLLRVNGQRITGVNRFDSVGSRPKIKRYRKKRKIKYGFEPKLKWSLAFAGICILIGLMQMERTVIMEFPDRINEDSTYQNWSPCGLKVVECPGEYKEKFEATVTAYNTVKAQTDDSPCIAAYGDNICGMDQVIACPIRYQKGTRVEIDGVVYTCLDKMNPKYWEEDRFDISFDKDIEGAVNYGNKLLTVRILN